MGNAAGPSDGKYLDEPEHNIIQLETTLQNNIISFEKKAAELEAKNAKPEAKNTTLEQKNEHLLEKLKLALSRTFARHTERFTGEGRMALSDAGEALAPTVKKNRKKQHLTRGRRRGESRFPTSFRGNMCTRTQTGKKSSAAAGRPRCVSGKK
jgi:hypothetical protein